MPRRSPFVLAAILAILFSGVGVVGSMSDFAQGQDLQAESKEAPSQAAESDDAAGGAAAGGAKGVEQHSETPESGSHPQDAGPDGKANEDKEASPAKYKEPEMKPWEKKIDNFFKKYIVDKLKAVLFYDFGTEKWLGASVPFVVAWLFVGATFFTIRMGFINLRAFRHAIHLVRGDYDNPEETGEVSHFQALSSALSATVGLGNIAGVAIAIGTGGPGATFWMIVVGLLGMTSKFTECTLGQMYRKVAPDGTVSGGPMHYLRDGLAELNFKPLGSLLAILFTILCICASFGGGNAFQVSQSLGAVRMEFPWLHENPWCYGLVLAFFVGVVIIGGIRSIGAVASKIVPFMCTAYVLMALYIIFANFSHVDDALVSIWDGVFTPRAAWGGFLGVLVTGIRRAAFSNEAGVGSAAIAHSAARTDEPVSEGIVALLEPFIDTVVVCTMTALVIIITGVYDPHANPELASYIANDKGAALTAVAVSGEHGVSWFRWILYMAVILFAYSTLISWSYYGERCWTHLFGERSSMVYKVIFVVFTFLGSVVTAKNALGFSDYLILGMAIPNILGLYFMSGKVKRALDDYWGRVKSGEIKPHGQA